MVSILSIFVFFFPAIVLLETFRQIFLPPPAFSPESIAFESPGRAFYTGVSDDHIFKYQPLTGWTVFVITSSNRYTPTSNTPN